MWEISCNFAITYQCNIIHTEYAKAFGSTPLWLLSHSICYTIMHTQTAWYPVAHPCISTTSRIHDWLPLHPKQHYDLAASNSSSNYRILSLWSCAPDLTFIFKVSTSCASFLIFSLCVLIVIVCASSKFLICFRELSTDPLSDKEKVGMAAGEA